MIMATHAPLSEKEASEIKGNRSFWQNCTNSYAFGGKDFYPRVERMLDRVIPKFVTKDMDVADVGCADGRFTHQISKYCRSIHGYEFADQLLEQAKQNYPLSNGAYAHIDLEQDDWIKALPAKVDAITFFGVFASLHKPDIIESVAKDAFTHLPADGYLITRDTLSRKETYKVQQNGYYSHFRNMEEYYRSFKNAGFHLVYKETMVKHKKSVHVINVFAKSPRKRTWFDVKGILDFFRH